MDERKNVLVKPEVLSLTANLLPPLTLLKVAFYKHCFILAEDLYHESKPDSKTSNISDQRRRKLYGAIVFLAFALESFINEIGLERCSDDFDSIDKLATPDKWILIPKLCSKPSLNKGTEPFQSIAAIFRYRNLFAHFKPQFKEFQHKDYQKMREVTHNLFKSYYNNTIYAMKILRKEFVISELEWLDNKKL